MSFPFFSPQSRNKGLNLMSLWSWLSSASLHHDSVTSPANSASASQTAVTFPLSRAMHFPRRSKASPNQINLDRLLKSDKLRPYLAVKKITATKIAALRRASAGNFHWCKEINKKPDQDMLRRPSPATNQGLHLHYRGKSDAREISLAVILASSTKPVDDAEQLNRAVMQVHVLRNAALRAAMSAGSHDRARLFKAGGLNNRPARLSRWQNRFRRLVKISAPKNYMKRSTSFAQDLLFALSSSPELNSLLEKSGQSLPLDGALTREILDLWELALHQPERAAVELLFALNDALLRRSDFDISVALNASTTLLVAPQFSTFLVALAAQWREEQAPPSHIHSLQLFLASTAWLWSEDLFLPDIWDSSSEQDDLWPTPFLAWTRKRLGAPSPSATSDKSHWIVSGRTPLAWMGNLPAKDLTLTLVAQPKMKPLGSAQIDRVRPPQSTTRIQAGHDQLLPPYSAAEDALSQRTERLAHLLTTALSDMVGSDLRQPWFPALNLVIDDLVFGSCREFWGALNTFRVDSSASKGIFCATSDHAAAFAAGLEALGFEGEVQIVEPASICSADAPHAIPLHARLLDLLQAKLSRSNEDELRQGVERAILESRVTPGPPKAALLIGRRFDRNYETDMAALGSAIRSNGRPVIFMPTTVGSLKGHVAGMFEKDEGNWHSHSFHQAAITQLVPPHLAWTSRKKGILSSILDHLQQNEALETLDLALLVIARKQLEKFFAEKLLRYVKSGALIAEYVKVTMPSYLALMPGRDFIARVATMTARQHEIASFDVQTVFVGARSRYKPTWADVQLTIETESQRLFQHHFKLAPSRTVLAGCSKVGIVRQKAQESNREAVRTLLNLGPRFNLVFAGSPFLAEDKPILETLVRGLDLWPDTNIGIRLHPTSQQDFANYCDELARKHPHFSVLKQLNLPQTLVSADVLVTRFSNVGLEAGLLNRDVIACNFGHEPAPIQLDAMGVASAATDPADLLDCIADFRRHGPRWNQLQNTRRTYHENNPQLFVASSAEYMRDLMENWSKPACEMS